MFLVNWYLHLIKGVSDCKMPEPWCECPIAKLEESTKNTFSWECNLNPKQPFSQCFAHFVRFVRSVVSHSPILLPNWKTISRREMIEKWKSIWDELGSQFPDPLRLWRSRRLANPLSERLLLCPPPSTIDCFFLKQVHAKKKNNFNHHNKTSQELQMLSKSLSVY